MGKLKETHTAHSLHTSDSYTSKLLLSKTFNPNGTSGR